jgi:hypothetical protein
MGDVIEAFRIISLVGFIWNFTVAIWRHHQGGEWQYPAFLAIVFQAAAMGAGNG